METLMWVGIVGLIHIWTEILVKRSTKEKTDVPDPPVPFRRIRGSKVSG